MIEVKIDSICISNDLNLRVVVLKDAKTDWYLPIWVGTAEGAVILSELQKQPLTVTDQLLQNPKSQGTIAYVVISENHDYIFFGQIVLKHTTGKLDVNVRPSEALPVAVRQGVSIH